MALNIPMPELPGNALLKGVQTGGNLFSQIMSPIIEREKQKQLDEHFEKEMKLKQAQMARSGRNDDLNRKILQQQLLEHELKTNPKKLFEFIQQIKNQGNQSSEMQPFAQNTEMTPFSGSGMPSSEEMDNPTPVPELQEQQSNASGLFGNLTPDQQAMLQMAGIKIPTTKENPEQKRFAELKNKMQLEQYKTEQKKAFEQEKLSLKNEALRQKTVEKAKNDLPHLNQTLDALNKMEQIALKNPDLFGHNGIMGFGGEGAAERFAKITKNPNAGAWQTYGLGPIIAAEGKMSSKGNQLALKAALANKPNFGESQQVALAKIKAAKQQIKDSINETKSLAGEKNTNNENENEKVIVISPDGKRFKTTKANATNLPEGWSHG